ncbi:hypothetical protein ACET3X_006412 [Alternaria dauci]|uniref:Uncharacterized protein n=1 Tax=Alternaria dauci TaxID=48095 RepID=A0ABR3UDL5_9PLEO
MHQDMISSPEGTTANGRELDEVEPQGLEEAEKRWHNEPIRSKFSVNSALQSDLDPVLAPAPDKASETSIHPAFSEQTGSTTFPSLPLFLGRFRGLKDTWRVPAAILGFYLISFLCAAAHYCFFAYLDGRIISPGFMLSTKTTTVPQAYVTTVSLILVTAFRAALVASIGTCYTQYLWATFRKRVLRVSLIEDLFQVQTNPLRLLNYHLYFKTPILVAVAIFCWLVPIATIYPPGTLVVGIQPSAIDKSFNVSVLHHRNRLDIFADNVIAPVECSYNCTNQGCVEWAPQFLEVAEDAPLPDDCILQGATPGLGYITRSNLIVGELSRLKQASREENTSYELSFFGTTLDCETTNRSMESTILPIVSNRTISDLQMPIGWIQYPEPICNLKCSNRTLTRFSLENRSIIYSIAHYQEVPRYWPCLDEKQWMPSLDDPRPQVDQAEDCPGSGIHVIVPITETVCHPKIVRYHVTISNAREAQHVSFIIEDDKSIPPYTEDFPAFNGNFEQWTKLSDAVRIYDDFAMNLNQSGSNFLINRFNHSGISNATTPYTTINGTVEETCVLESELLPGIGVASSLHDIWPLSVFEQRLPRKVDDGCTLFDPDMANELLINTTISALSLNQRFDMVNGTETRSFNVYRFENKLAFFLPYGLSLALAIPILALGFIALYSQNHGVSAITGGFLQLLMTTTGRNSLEAVVTRGSGTLGGYENVSKELYEMEVRFGELIEGSGHDITETDTLLSGHEGGTEVQEDDGTQSGVQTVSGTEWCEKSVSVVRRAGFGTVHEVGLFRKKGEQQSEYQRQEGKV